jgi:outer membrane protein OmpA-like peptidoglycan-associated protein
MADRKVATARALAEARHAEDQRQALVAERDRARLEARTAEAESARMEADAARSQAVALQQQIEALHAQQTDRGLVMTLGDVLFETGRSELKTGSVMELGQLVTFLRQQTDRTVVIEGHTDSVGGEAANLQLSERRADAVRAYLVSQGIDASRVRASGMGEAAPVATNDTSAGRQQNRRVEIVISNPGPGGM